MVPKIADFGISKSFDEKQSIESIMQTFPCRGYIAPESYGGVISLKSDIYSLGIIIIEILTGQKCCPDIQNVRKFISHVSVLKVVLVGHAARLSMNTTQLT
ncbi:hypothetical protein PR202_ga24650 [Eleusine coracana subsp. coracana]|uniref:Protein kinase domain-containing protein n=1 Tax=Eleusine coracana subsp. coracana TaxID=191504 RepID=A0AAV5DA34_ELECO|nr:hypothetical protein PR202_ga24650 [Eleusine coracana subsp. coracana]